MTRRFGQIDPPGADEVTRRSTARHFARLFDVPPWVLGVTPKPRFARARWALRRIWKV